MMGMATIIPAMGPEAPMSSSAFFDLMRSRMTMTAPIVPKGVKRGIGMKRGNDAFTR